MKFSLVLLLIAQLCAGCSWIAVQGPPRELPVTGEISCTSSATAPIADTVVSAAALTAGIVLLAVAATPSCSPPDAGHCEPHNLQAVERMSAIGAFTFSVPFVISAVSGYSNVSSCREMRERASGPIR